MLIHFGEICSFNDSKLISKVWRFNQAYLTPCLYRPRRMKFTSKTVAGDSDRATRRPDCPSGSSRGCSASSTPCPRTSPPVSTWGTTPCHRRSRPPSSSVGPIVADSSTRAVNYLHCEPSGTVSTSSRAVSKIPANQRQRHCIAERNREWERERERERERE